MNKFDELFFRDSIGSDDQIIEVFHRHFFVIAEDILLWLFFAIIIPAFFYYFDVFSIQSGMPWYWVWLYFLSVYAIVMYKVFDWYTDVWVATESNIVAMKWRWFTSSLLFVPYEKIDGIEVRTHSWITSLFRMSDVVIRLHGENDVTLESAENTKKLIGFLQDRSHGSAHHGDEHDGDKEPFNILVDTLSDIVKGHLTTQWKSYITRDYVEKLDSVLHTGVPIDLRSTDEKIVIENWKEKNQKKESHGSHDHEHDSHEEH